MAGSGELTDRERVFVREYLVDLNGTAAAIRAGYAPNSAAKHTHRVFNRPRVKAAIEAAMATRARALEITAENVLREIALLGFANMMDYFTPQEDGTAYVDLSRLTREQAAAITEVQVEEFVSGRGAAGREVRRVKIKLADKKGYLELIGKHLGMFTQRHEHTGKDGGPIETNDIGLSNIERAQEILRLLAAAETGKA